MESQKYRLLRTLLSVRISIDVVIRDGESEISIIESISHVLFHITKRGVRVCVLQAFCLCPFDHMCLLITLLIVIIT